MATETELPLIRGDSQEWTIRLTGADRAPLPLRSLEVRIVAKPDASDQADDGDALYVHTATFDANGTPLAPVGLRVVGDPGDGVLEEFLTATDITVLAAVYDGLRTRDTRLIARWDMQVTDGLGRRKTVLSGGLSMTRDVGRLG